MKKKTTESFIENAKLIHGDRYDYNNVKYSGSKNNVEIICSKHGIFLQTPNNHLRSGGCNKCGYDVSSDKTRSTISEFINKVTRMHGDKYDYTNSVYSGAHKNIVIKCSKHGEFTLVANTHVKGVGCAKCSLVEQGLNRRLTTSEFIDKANEVHRYRYDYSLTEYVTSQCNVKIKCDVHCVFEQTPNDHLDGCGCQGCNATGYNVFSEGYLYLLRSTCGQRIKVGITNNIKGRIGRLKQSTPFEFNVIEYVKGDGRHIREMEKITHGFLTSLNLKGFDGCTEWFGFDPIILIYFKKLKGE